MFDINNKKIFFLISYPRSGNTWMTLILKDLFNVQLSEIGNKNLKGKTLNFDTFETILYGTTSDSLYGNNTEYNYDDDFLCVKTHQYFDEKYPLNNKVIYLIRDPRDVMLSYYFHQKMKIKGILKEFDGHEFSEFLNQHLHRWEKHVEVWTKRDCLVIKYEDLKIYPMETLKKIEKYLNCSPINSYENIIKKHIINPTYITNKNDKFFRKAIIGDFKNYLGKEHLEYFNKVKDILEKLNYKDSNEFRFKR